MSIGQEAMHAPQYMQSPLFTTSVTRLPKIFSFFGNGFQPSPSTLDLSGARGGAVDAGLAAVVGEGSPAGGFAEATGVVTEAGTVFSGAPAGGVDMYLVPLLFGYLGCSSRGFHGEDVLIILLRWRSRQPLGAPD